MCYVVARAYSLEQQNAGRAYVGPCHASSVFLFCFAFMLVNETKNTSL